ncbi:hypothetical protein AK812_SmicGene19604 [Symbiodinium microadriaticum]|uniref:Uncharacterized protein n=1 Tax=Symbiodinium microadriaticum TaxID=2951 RepID=A0A1Q9DS78_SYMMI|nr:hypothetical protein AK812_SmicGene19604 [Symbiodinium microadriaticum]
MFIQLQHDFPPAGSPVSPLDMLASSLSATISPYAVPQGGFLLFASSSARGMPGGLMLRRITFYNTMLGSQQVEEQYLNSRYQREKKPPPQQLALSSAMKKAAPVLWLHGSFLCEFADCFINSAGGDLVHLLRSFTLGLEGACKSIGESSAGGPPLWSTEQQTTLYNITELFQRSEPLFKKWQPLWTAEDHAVPSLAASYVRRLQTVRQNLRNQGGSLLIPLGIKTINEGSQMILMILEKKDAQTYRLTIINSGAPGLEWHACSSAEPPKFKSQAALAFEDIPSSKAEDDAFWAMLVVTCAIPPSPMMAKEPLPLYDKFIPWLIGCPLEHYLVMNVYALDGQAPEQEQCEAGQDLRTPQYGGTGAWRCMTFALRFLLRDRGLSVVTAKLVKWHLRRSFLKLSLKDLATARALSTSERTVLRIAAKQFALGAVKVSNRLASDAPSMAGDARSVVSEVEAAVVVIWQAEFLQTCGLSGMEGGQWNRELRSILPLLVPINLLQVPTSVSDLDEVHRALQLCEILCAKLAFVGKVFTELIPLPLGPWLRLGCSTPADDASCPTGARLSWNLVSRSFDATKITVFGSIAAIADRVARTCEDPVTPEPKSALTEALNGTLGGRPVAIDPNTFLVSETIETAAPELNLALASGFRRKRKGEVLNHHEIKKLKDETLFDWDTYGPGPRFCLHLPCWMMYVEREKGLERVVHGAQKQMCAKHLLETGKDWGKLVAGNQSENAYLVLSSVRTWPEFAALRDIIFFWKYFMCQGTDLRVFPDTSSWSLQAAYLTWNVANESEVFGPPTNRGHDHVLKTNEPNYRLYLRSLPTFEALSGGESESVGTGELPFQRHAADLETLRAILHAVVLEPGKFLMPGRWQAELLATPFGQPGARLLTELSCSPKMPPAAPMELPHDQSEGCRHALVLANSVTSDTVGVVLFASSPLLAASLNMSECRAQEEGKLENLRTVLAELRSGKQYIRAGALLCSSNDFSSIVLYMGGQSSKGGMTAELVGKDPPDFEMTLEDGSTKKLSDFLGSRKPVIIDFYANF